MSFLLTFALTAEALCKWKTQTSGANAVLQCMDGTRCNWGEHELQHRCCSNNGGIELCPLDSPVMCGTKDACEGDYCCTPKDSCEGFKRLCVLDTAGSSPPTTTVKTTTRATATRATTSRTRATGRTTTKTTEVDIEDRDESSKGTSHIVVICVAVACAVGLAISCSCAVHRFRNKRNNRTSKADTREPKPADTREPKALDAREPKAAPQTKAASRIPASESVVASRPPHTQVRCGKTLKAMPKSAYFRQYERLLAAQKKAAGEGPTSSTSPAAME